MLIHTWQVCLLCLHIIEIMCIKMKNLSWQVWLWQMSEQKVILFCVLYKSSRVNNLTVWLKWMFYVCCLFRHEKVQYSIVSHIVFIQIFCLIHLTALTAQAYLKKKKSLTPQWIYILDKKCIIHMFILINVLQNGSH